MLSVEKATFVYSEVVGKRVGKTGLVLAASVTSAIKNTKF